MVQVYLCFLGGESGLLHVFYDISSGWEIGSLSQHIIRGACKKRSRSKLYLFNSVGMVGVYSFIVILNFVLYALFLMASTRPTLTQNEQSNREAGEGRVYNWYGDYSHGTADIV